jgi:hypothetical protein
MRCRVSGIRELLLLLLAASVAALHAAEGRLHVGEVTKRNVPQM